MNQATSLTVDHMIAGEFYTLTMDDGMFFDIVLLRLVLIDKHLFAHASSEYGFVTLDVRRIRHIEGMPSDDAE